jgi:hypothetical protein
VMGAILRRRALKRRLEAHQQLGRVALLMELTQIDALDRYRQRLTLPRLALTGIRHSPWRTLYASQDPRAFMSTLALTPEVFAELLALVRACAWDRWFFLFTILWLFAVYAAVQGARALVQPRIRYAGAPAVLSARGCAGAGSDVARSRMLRKAYRAQLR